MGGLEADKEVDVIRDPANRERNSAHIFNDSPEVGMKFWAKRGFEPLLSFVRRENEMVMQGVVGGGHLTIMSFGVARWHDNFSRPCRGALTFRTANRGLHPRLRSVPPAGD